MTNLEYFKDKIAHEFARTSYRGTTLCEAIATVARREGFKGVHDAYDVLTWSTKKYRKPTVKVAITIYDDYE